MSIVSGELWDAWDRMTTAELALFVGLHGVAAVPDNLHRRAERIGAVMNAARDVARPSLVAKRRQRQSAELLALWEKNTPVAGATTPTDPLKRLASRVRATQWQRRKRAEARAGKETGRAAVAA